MLNLTHVRSFLLVVDQQGVRSAASVLDVSPSTILEHVRQLEEHLAAPLLERRTGRVRPSRYGLRFLPYARALVRTATRARELISEPRLRVAAASNVGVYLLQPPVAAFRRQHDVEVEIWIGSNPDVSERLERGEADVAVLECWDERLGYLVIDWKREPLVVIVSPDHEWAQRRSIYAEELATEIILGGEPGTGTGRVLKEQLGSLAEGLRVRSGFGSTEAVKKAVQAGHGSSVVLHASVAEEISSGRLSALEIEGVALAKQLKVILPDNLPVASMPGLFATFLLMHYK